MLKAKKDKDRWFIKRMATLVQGQGKVRLGFRRAYILPTPKGLYYTVTLIVLFIWSVNYGLSLGYFITFFVAVFAILITILTVMNISGIILSAIDSVGDHPIFFAKEPAFFRLLVHNPKQEASIHLKARRNGLPAKTISLSPKTMGVIQIPLDTPERGLHTLGYVRLCSDYPVGIFRSWSWFYFQTKVLVYPAPVGDLPLPFQAQHSGQVTGQGARQGHEDFADLRTYHPGDSIRQITWKKAALGQINVKTYQSPLAEQQCCLDFDDERLLAKETEQRLSQLCIWVLQAERLGIRYCLKLPGQQIDFDLGLAQRTRCLEALACY